MLNTLGRCNQGVPLPFFVILVVFVLKALYPCGCRYLHWWRTRTAAPCRTGSRASSHRGNRVWRRRPGHNSIADSECLLASLSGLLNCGHDCGHSMKLQQGKGVPRSRLLRRGYVLVQGILEKNIVDGRRQRLGSNGLTFHVFGSVLGQLDDSFCGPDGEQNTRTFRESSSLASLRAVDKEAARGLRVKRAGSSTVVG